MSIWVAGVKKSGKWIGVAALALMAGFMASAYFIGVYFVRFDFNGHGQSEGRFEEMSLRPLGRRLSVAVA